jgi:uncharacterized integral membrane protein (TIGR00698 family)
MSGVGVMAAWHPRALRRSWPGLSVAIVIALAATYVSTSYGGPQLLYALFFGLAFHFLSLDPTCQPGIDFCSKTMLRTGVALLGAKITFAQMVSLGITPLLTVICALLTTMLFGWALARWLGRPSSEGVLAGGAVAICGASAALAIAAVLPQTKENEKFTLLTVVGVTTLSTLAMIVYPLLVKVLHLDPTAAGIFLGGTIHDVAQVVGAGYMLSNHTGDVATLVKLTRVACLVPVVLALSFLFTRRGAAAAGGAAGGQPLVPIFLLGFVALMIVNSFGWIAPQAAAALGSASRACLVTAIAALGMKTSFQSLASLGWRPVLMLVADTVWIAGFVLVALMLEG